MTDRKPTEEMIAAGLEHYAEGGCMGMTEEERREAVCSILAAALAASPAAPGAEVEPVAWGEFYGGRCAAVRLDRSVHCQTPLYLSPPPADAIRAQARRGALEGAMAAALSRKTEWARKAAEPGRSDHDVAVFESAASAAAEIHADIQRLAGKPGEAE